MVAKEVKISCASFACGVLFNIFLYSGGAYNPSIYLKPLELFFWLILLIFLSANQLQIGLTGYGLGFLFITGLIHSLQGNSVFWWYLSILTFFHFSEFLTTGLTNPANLSFDSYLVNHSAEYVVAAVASWAEFSLEFWLLPSIKHLHLVSCIGVFICILGEIIRKLAMVHASTNFSHIIQDTKDENHKLVTSGIYSWCRHPSYVGWFLWSIGTQLVLVNPLCFVAYSAVSFSFFKGRIYVEEYTLLLFFGEEYSKYQERVGTGIPFITGYKGPSRDFKRD